eukprot:GHVQ01041636.1.p1 GENE.GHVQ01041636.1~~GHVQ01041636.1.p1  ORF type:complete len:1038 (+),score=130.88 GHVQ01041636.1:413-3115(+)
MTSAHTMTNSHAQAMFSEGSGVVMPDEKLAAALTEPAHPQSGKEDSEVTTIIDDAASENPESSTVGPEIRDVSEVSEASENPVVKTEEAAEVTVTEPPGPQGAQNEMEEATTSEEADEMLLKKTVDAVKQHMQEQNSVHTETRKMIMEQLKFIQMNLPEAAKSSENAEVDAVDFHGNIRYSVQSVYEQLATKLEFHSVEFHGDISDEAQNVLRLLATTLDTHKGAVDNLNVVFDSYSDALNNLCFPTQLPTPGPIAFMDPLGEKLHMTRLHKSRIRSPTELLVRYIATDAYNISYDAVVILEIKKLNRRHVTSANSQNFHNVQAARITAGQDALQPVLGRALKEIRARDKKTETHVLYVNNADKVLRAHRATISNHEKIVKFLSDSNRPLRQRKTYASLRKQRVQTYQTMLAEPDFMLTKELENLNQLYVDAESKYQQMQSQFFYPECGAAAAVRELVSFLQDQIAALHLEFSCVGASVRNIRDTTARLKDQSERLQIDDGNAARATLRTLKEVLPRITSVIDSYNTALPRIHERAKVLTARLDTVMEEARAAKEHAAIQLVNFRARIKKILLDSSSQPTKLASLCKIADKLPEVTAEHAAMQKKLHTLKQKVKQKPKRGKKKPSEEHEGDIHRLTTEMIDREHQAQTLRLNSVLVERDAVLTELRLSELETVAVVQEEELNLAQDSIAYIKMLQGEAMLILGCSQNLEKEAIEAAEISETGLSSKTLLNEALDFVDGMTDQLTDPVLERLSTARKASNIPAEQGLTGCLVKIHAIANSIKDGLKSEEKTWVTESGELKPYVPWPGFDVATLGDLNTVGDIIKQLSPFLTHGNDAKIDPVGLSMLTLLAVTIPEAVETAREAMAQWESLDNDDTNDFEETAAKRRKKTRCLSVGSDKYTC